MSGSPVFFENSQSGYQFVGVYSGSKDNLCKPSSPIASALDPDAHDWALSVVQSDGYLLDMDLIDEDKWGENPEQHWGPHKSFLDDLAFRDDYHAHPFITTYLQWCLE